VTSAPPITVVSDLRNGHSRASRAPAILVSPWVFPQKLFAHALHVERKRSERSGRSFVLMLLESARLLKPGGLHQELDKILLALSNSSRDTDTLGWYKEGSSLGLIFTEPGDNDPRSVVNTLRIKVTRALAGTLTASQLNEISLSFHIFPEDWDELDPGNDSDGGSRFDDRLYLNTPKRGPMLAKRLMDIAGSLMALAFCLPLFLIVAIAIKRTSKGPVFFCQRRLGLHGRTFNLLKFRSMYENSDAEIHQKFTADFIADKGTCGQLAEGAPYKITIDPRVTRVGRFLRRTSLDELPQFLNVLKGEMSLVGPRPPVLYEAARYDVWHRTRLLDAKPGITGLWQVYGRSRVKFDEMVRMDLRYAANWSLWLDIRILFLTPRAVLSGSGAY